MLPFWLLGILHLVLWVKIHSSEVGAECDAANTVLSLITSALFLCTPYFHMLWVIHSECVMGEWAKTLLALIINPTLNPADSATARTTGEFLCITDQQSAAGPWQFLQQFLSTLALLHA